MTSPNFKKVTFLCMQQLTNFPYIEEDFDALTNYELLSKVVEYLNEVIANENTQNQTILELYNSFNDLKNYVDNYFENLDVQDEINNKLDEMVEDGTFANVLKTLTKFPLYGTGINATVTAYSNVKNPPIPVLTDNIGDMIDYNDFDNVINTIVTYTDYNSESYKGYYSTIDDITSTSITFNEPLPDNYIKNNMWIILTNGLPTKSNWRYLGKVNNYNAETKTVYVEEWISYATKEAELPENVTYAWLNPLTKLYGQNFSLHNNFSNLKGLIGSQCDIYGNGEENYIVGYSPVIRSGIGNAGLRVRSVGQSTKWNRGISLEGNYDSLLSTDNGSLINGDESLNLMRLGISSGNINARTPLWAINQNTNLNEFTATQGALYFVYNASDSPITLTGTFRGFGSENLSTIEIPARQIIPIFAVTTNVYLLVSSYFTNYETKIQNDKFNSNMVAITKNTNITDDIFPYIVTNGQAVYNFIVAGSDITLSLTSGVIYLNGTNSALSCTLKARTSGTIYINRGNNAVYINSVQP